MNGFAATTWMRVNRRQPCPVCQAPDWCTVSADGDVAICMRTKSDRPVDCGGAGLGYLHRLTVPLPPPRQRVAPRASQRPSLPSMKAAYRQWLSATTPDQVRHLSDLLGLRTDSLRRLGFAWAPPHRAWAIPMFTAAAELCGLRLRSEAGDKWCVTGSKQGLFLPDGDVPDLLTELLIVEGPTDCAALLDVGLYGVGRPSCSGGHDLLLPLARGRDVVIIADRDEPKRRPDGSLWSPGQEGAERLAEHLFGRCRTLKVIKPLVGKDTRKWVEAGATADVIRNVIANKQFWRPANG